MKGLFVIIGFVFALTGCGTDDGFGDTDWIVPIHFETYEKDISKILPVYNENEDKSIKICKSDNTCNSCWVNEKGDCSCTMMECTDNHSEISETSESFEWKMLEKFVVDDGENVFYSPYSIKVAMGMVSEGADGNTLKELMSLLDVKDLDESREFLSRLRKIFNTKGKEYDFSEANGIWFQESDLGGGINQDYVDLIVEDYDSVSKEVDFVNNHKKIRTEINDWVSNNTNDLIEDLLRKGALDANTASVLVNAIYFKGDWLKPFEKRDTSKEKFELKDESKVKVDMMRQEEKFKYAEDDKYQLLEMPYKGRDLSMVVALPKDDVGMIGEDDYLRLADAMYWKYVDLSFPKFEIDGTTKSLKRTFQDLGVVDAFDFNKANFSGMSSSQGLYIGDVLHQAYMKVDEKGTEAAAATAAVMQTLSYEFPPTNVIEFNANKPFTYMIKDNESGEIIFMGYMFDPR